MLRPEYELLSASQIDYYFFSSRLILLRVSDIHFSQTQVKINLSMFVILFWRSVVKLRFVDRPLRQTWLEIN